MSRFWLLFFQLIARQYEKTSTVFTSKKTFSLWSEVFADVTISSAILNRIQIGRASCRERVCDLV